jgi:hypothetical protein
MRPSDYQEEALEHPRPGRPMIGLPRRVRITTTIEPAKLALLRDHARREHKSLGQLADEYVDEHFLSEGSL